MSELAEFRGNASQELTSFIREGLQAFIEFFQTSQFKKMARFYSPDTTLMLPHRGVIRGAEKLPALFRELKDAGLRDWRIEPNRVEQFGDIALEYGTHQATERNRCRREWEIPCRLAASGRRSVADPCRHSEQRRFRRRMSAACRKAEGLRT